MIVIFKNYLKNLDLDWDISGVQAVLELQIDEKLIERDNLISKLPIFQKNIINSIINSDPTEEVINLSNQIMQNETKALKELSPKYWCNEIQNNGFVFHGANDSMVPFTESVKMGKDIQNSEVLISYLYEHKEISTNSGIFSKLKELFKMERFFASYFRYNEN